MNTLSQIRQNRPLYVTIFVLFSFMFLLESELLSDCNMCGGLEPIWLNTFFGIEQTHAIGSCGKAVTIERDCCPDESRRLNFELQDFLESKCDIDWGKQGPFVVVTCGTQFPAKGTRVQSTVRGGEITQDYSCPGGSAQPCTASYTLGDKHYFFAQDAFGVFEITPGSIRLRDLECATLQKAKEAKVDIYHQKSEYSEMCPSCDSSPTTKLYWARLTERKWVEDVKVKFWDGVWDCRNCPMPGTPTTCPYNVGSGGTNGGGCSSGSCGNPNKSGMWASSVGNVTINVSPDLSGTLTMYGSPDVNMSLSSYGTPEINAAGVWLRATHYPFQAGVQSYTTDPPNPGVDDTITKITYTFELIVWGNYTYHYEFILDGSWEKQTDPAKSNEQVAFEAFLEAARGKVQLKYVTKGSGQNAQRILEFLYDQDGNVEEQISYSQYTDPTTNEKNGFVKYDYDENSSLSRIWVGKNENEYGDPPTGGRWVDVIYAEEVDDQKSLLGVASECSSCRTALNYEYGGLGNQITKIIRASDSKVLASYEYDSRGRYLSHSLGQGEDELKVNEWQYSDYDPAFPIQTHDDNITVRKDYVDNTRYRAKVYFADPDGTLIKEVHYHHLQTDPDWLQGPYSVYKYYHVSDETDGLQYVTEYPKGNKKIKCYYDYDNDGHGSVKKVFWEHDSSNLEAEYVYPNTPVSYGGDTRYLIQKEINAYGGKTEYTYENFNIKTRTEPVPGPGVVNGTQDRQVITYVYDDNVHGRIDHEYRKDSTGTTDVYTKYVYDSTGNLKQQIENWDHTGQDPSQELITYYEYNEYNELYKTTYPSGRVERKFYSDSGTVIADAVYKDYDAEIAVSATIYIYEDGKLMHLKRAKMNDPFTFTDDIVQDEGEGYGITWVQESYEYDVYGRKIAVIADSGSGRQSLRTEYEYNNQNEITKVVKPDKRYKRTERDGRGLIVAEITGIQDGETEVPKATTQYFYDLNGNLKRKVNPDGVTEIYQYDLKDRLVKTRRGK